MKILIIILFASTFIYSQHVKMGFELTYAGNNIIYATNNKDLNNFIEDKKGFNLIHLPLPYFVTGIEFNEDYGIDIKAGWTILTTAEPFTIGVFPRIRLYDKLYLMGVLNRHFEDEGDRMTQGNYGFDGFTYGGGLTYSFTRVFSVNYNVQFTSPKENYYIKSFSIGQFEGPPRITLTKIDYIMQLGFNFKWDLL